MSYDRKIEKCKSRIATHTADPCFLPTIIAIHSKGQKLIKTPKSSTMGWVMLQSVCWLLTPDFLVLFNLILPVRFIHRLRYQSCAMSWRQLSLLVEDYVCGA